MAYNVYVSCNECGVECNNFTNETISVSKYEKYARRRGWYAKNPRWYCPEHKHLACKKENEEEKP